MSKASEFLSNFIFGHPQMGDAWTSKFIGPGQIILRKMTDEQRELLKTLKSKDMQNMRSDFVGIPKRKGRWG